MHFRHSVGICEGRLLLVFQLDEFLMKMDNPDYWRTIKDKLTGEEVVLNDDQIDLIQRLQKSSYPEHSVDPYEVAS
jgi:ribosome biogenesis protein ERB1